jgi:hypothetical protein
MPFAAHNGSRYRSTLAATFYSQHGWERFNPVEQGSLEEGAGKVRKRARSRLSSRSDRGQSRESGNLGYWGMSIERMALLLQSRRTGRPHGGGSAQIDAGRAVAGAVLSGIASAQSQPLFFHHISKTAGTSVTAAIRSMTKRSSVISKGGNLPLAFVQKIVAAGLRPDQFIYGHPAHGVSAVLRGKTRIITLLRDPVEQSISNYLFIRSDFGNPDRRAARRMDFAEFIRTYPYYAAFQAGSLAVGLRTELPTGAAELATCLPEICAFLDEMFLVGTVEGVEDFMHDLAHAMGWQSVPKLRHLRKGRAPQSERAALRMIRATLEDDPNLATRFAIERAVYQHASAIAARRRNSQRARTVTTKSSIAV